MSRPTVAELDLPLTVWVAAPSPGFKVQALAADGPPFGTRRAFRDWWGTSLGMVLRNDQLTAQSPLDSQYILASVRHVQGDRARWDALTYLQALEPQWTARHTLRRRERNGLRPLRVWEVDLFSDKAAALEAQVVYDSREHTALRSEGEPS